MYDAARCAESVYLSLSHSAWRILSLCRTHSSLWTWEAPCNIYIETTEIVRILYLLSKLGSLVYCLLYNKNKAYFSFIPFPSWLLFRCEMGSQHLLPRRLRQFILVLKCVNWWQLLLPPLSPFLLRLSPIFGGWQINSSRDEIESPRCLSSLCSHLPL